MSHDYCCLAKARVLWEKIKRTKEISELNEIISTVQFVSENQTKTFGTMNRETAGCFFLDTNSFTSINFLLSLNFLDFIINKNIIAYSILLYIQGSQSILQVLMNE